MGLLDSSVGLREVHSACFAFLSWAIFSFGFMLRDRDNTAHKIRQTLEGSSVRRFSLYRFGFLPLRGDPSRRRGGILADQLTIGQATTGD